MKMLEVLRFEVEYQSKRWWTWLYFAALFAIPFLIATQGAIEGPLSEGYWFNSPYGIGMLTLVGSFMGLLVAAAFSGEAGARDSESRMDSLIYTSPVAERSFVSGRFGAAFLLNALVLVMVQVALLTGTLIVNLPPELMGPIQIGTYITAYVLFALPNAFLATALFFSLSLFTRRSVAGYLAAVILFFTSVVVWLLVAMKFGRWDIAKIVDPLAMSVIQELGRTTTAAQKNAWLPWSDSSLLLNRAIWMSVAAAVIGIANLRFRFIAAGTRKGWRRSSPNVEPIDRSVPITVPKVELSSSVSGIRLQQFFVIAGQSFREVAISWGALVLVILSLILTVLGPKAMEHLGVPVIPTTEQMINWIGHTGEILWFIVPILSTFYAGELVWRDRETRMSEIADAAPVPQWIQFVGKFCGLALLILAYQVMQVIGCMLVQAQMGYFDFQPGLYVKAVLGLSLTEHLLFAAMALAAHVIINQKYVGYFVVIGIYALMNFAASFGIQNHLLIFGSSPEWTYSDMREFGPSLTPWVWFKSYWAGWTILLSIVATLLWVRGKETGFNERLVIMRERLTPRAIGGLAVMSALILVTGGFALYNTNVLNSGRSKDEWLALWARYEKKYGKFASLPQPQLAGISINAEIKPKEREATLHGTYTLVNRTGSPISSIHVLPDDEVETSAVMVDRPARIVVDDKELYYQIHDLVSPLLPGDSLHLKFAIRFKPHGFSKGGIDASVTSNGTYFEGNDWLPAIGYERAREVNSKADRIANDLPARREIPTLDDTAALYSTSPRRIAFDAVVSTDEDQTAVAPGELKRTWVENGRRYFHYAADAPIRNDFAIYSARYAVGRDKWNDVTIEVLHDARHTTNVDRMIRSSRASLEYFTRNFGPYPYREIRFVEQPGQSMTLHSSPINISYQEAFAGLDPDSDPRKFDLAYAVTAHEIGHQWWGNQLSPAEVEGGPVLTESLAWFSAMCVVAESLGNDHLQRLLDMMHEDAWTISSRAGAPLMRITNKFAAYRKGPFAMYALREYIGEDVVNSALRKLFDKYKSGEPPLPTAKDLYGELKGVTPDSLQPLLSDLFEKNTWWEVKTKAVSADSIGPGKWRVTLDVVARKVVVDTNGAETEVPMNDPVEVGVYALGGNTTRGIELHRALHRIKSGAQRISVVVSRKPVQAGIDPRNLLIDADPSDNMKGAPK